MVPPRPEWKNSFKILTEEFPKDFPKSFHSLNKVLSKSAVTNVAHSCYKMKSRKAVEVLPAQL